jgi:hypothetical protein
METVREKGEGEGSRARQQLVRGARPHAEIFQLANWLLFDAHI